MGTCGLPTERRKHHSPKGKDQIQGLGEACAWATPRGTPPNHDRFSIIRASADWLQNALYKSSNILVKSMKVMSARQQRWPPNLNLKPKGESEVPRGHGMRVHSVISQGGSGRCCNFARTCRRRMRDIGAICNTEYGAVRGPVVVSGSLTHPKSRNPDSRPYGHKYIWLYRGQMTLITGLLAPEKW